MIIIEKVAIFLFTTWANLGVLQAAPFRALITGPRITSLQTWIEQYLLLSTDESSSSTASLLHENDCKFVRILPTHFAANETHVCKCVMDPLPPIKRKLFQNARVKKGGGPWVVFASIGSV